MTRRGFFGLGTAGLATSTAKAKDVSLDDLRQRAIDHEMHYNTFVRKLFGCNLEGDVSSENCSAFRQELDYAAFTKARKAAMKLYDLVEAPTSTR